MAELNIPMTIINTYDEHVTDSRNIKAGYVVVYNGESMDDNFNIPAANLVPGTTVCDFANKKTYRYSGGTNPKWDDISMEGKIDSMITTKLTEVIVDGGVVTSETTSEDNP